MGLYEKIMGVRVNTIIWYYVTTSSLCSLPLLNVVDLENFCTVGQNNEHWYNTVYSCVVWEFCHVYALVGSGSQNMSDDMTV